MALQHTFRDRNPRARLSSASSRRFVRVKANAMHLKERRKGRGGLND
jgi:hypothetical protein